MRKELFKRHGGNPILTPKMWPYPAAAVFNAAATKDHEGNVVLIPRIEEMRGISHLGYAVSRDGMSQWRFSNKPFVTADEKCGESPIGGVEDPRIVWFEEWKTHVLTYVSFFCLDGEKGPPGVSLMKTNFENMERLGSPFLPDNKDACLFPERIDGKFVLIHRPRIADQEDIWLSFSPDLVHWGEHRRIISARYRLWNEHRVGLACQPIKTLRGWLIVFHGARDTALGGIYRLSLALLDLKELNVTHLSHEWVFEPEAEKGERNIVFSCGAVIDGEKILMYYGVDDRYISLATGNLNEILDYLLTQCPVE